MTEYSKGSHTVFHHRYHLVWITKDRYRVLQGDLRLRVRTIIVQVAEEMGVRIVNGVLRPITSLFLRRFHRMLRSVTS